MFASGFCYFEWVLRLDPVVCRAVCGFLVPTCVAHSPEGGVRDFEFHYLLYD